MPFADETTLEDVLKRVRTSTRGEDGRRIPIYINPIELQKAEKTMQSSVVIDLEGVPLRTSLRLVLSQLGMIYSVKDGMIVIEFEGDGGTHLPVAPDSFLVVGHCLLALLAAGIGASLAPLVCDPRGEPTA
jgi:hypothetical protein